MIKEKNPDLITIVDALTSSGKYPERMESSECTIDVKNNTESLIVQVNQLLRELNIEKAVVASGFRTQESNDNTANAAKMSKHKTGNAIDIQDLDGSLKKLIALDLLMKHSLYCEDFNYTKTWVHFQNIPPKSGRRFFIP